MPLSILDGSVPKLIEAIPNCSLGELEALLEAETNGKTRKSAIAALEEAIAAAEPTEEADDAPEQPEAPEEVEPADGMELIENTVEGSTLHLGDGRRLAFGESARVSPALAEMLRG